MPIQLKNMILIGAADRNVGKTELSGRIIRKFSSGQKITGVKITVIREKDGRCPRGGEGCGVCSSLHGAFCITREDNPDTGKDTSKMLRAGASGVYWLRVMQDSLYDGMKSLMDRICSEQGKDTCIVCESNSIRKAVEPGLFLVLNRAGASYVKKSCGEVMPLADRTVLMLPEIKGFDIDIDRICFEHGRWGLKEDAAAIVLAGGRSMRMGTDKCILDVGGRPLLEHVLDQLKPNFREVLISSDSAGRFGCTECRIVEDRKKNMGPLSGILSGLEASSFERNFVTACDIPDIFIPFLRRMLEASEKYDAVVPSYENGMIEPLFAVYRKSVLPYLEKTLNDGQFRVRNLLDRLNVYYVRIPEYVDIVNLNTEAEYRKYIGTA